MADQSRLDDLRRRIHRDPASIVFAQLAEECRRLGEFKEAVTVCRAGLLHHPGYVSARVTLGRALAALKKSDEAQLELERVLDAAPENLAALRGLADLHHRRGDEEQALACYRSALALAPGDADLGRAVRRLSRGPDFANPGSGSKEIGGTLKDAARARARRTINALEQWLAAIHVARAERFT